MTKTVICGALTLNRVTLKLYTRGLVRRNGYQKKKLHFACPTLPIWLKSLKVFNLFGGSVAAICCNFNQHGGNSTCNKNELVLIASSASVCRGYGPGLTRPYVWHSFLSANKSVSKMLLAQDCLPNWDLMCGPHGNGSGYDPDERRSLAPLSLSTVCVIAFAGNEYRVQSSFPSCCSESNSSQTVSKPGPGDLTVFLTVNIVN